MEVNDKTGDITPPIEPGTDQETLEDFILGGMRVFQPRHGYRFSIDAVLLAYFADIKPGESVMDFGTGCGVIPLILAWREENAAITGIDILPAAAKRAERNVLLNGLSHRIKIIQGDIKDIQNCLTRNSVQVVLSNPPYWKKNEGKISQNEEEAMARHEIGMELKDVVQAAGYLLSVGGRFYIIQRSDRLPELLKLLAESDFYPARIRMVHSLAEQPAKMLLVEAFKSKKARFTVSPPLIIYSAPGVYSPEVSAMYTHSKNDSEEISRRQEAGVK